VAKVLISIDERLLEQIDREARQRKMSRSALVAELAAKGLGDPIGPGASPEVHAAIRALEELFRKAPTGDSTAWIREDRDSRR
jgi:antirestriction protein ArdC